MYFITTHEAVVGTSFQVINEIFVFLNAPGVFYTWALGAGVGGRPGSVGARGRGRAGV